MNICIYKKTYSSNLIPLGSILKLSLVVELLQFSSSIVIGVAEGVASAISLIEFGKNEVVRVFAKLRSLNATAHKCSQISVFTNEIEKLEIFCF